MTSVPGVTALIPAYNAEATIARAIQSISHQVDQVLVLDDGSQDDTVRRIQMLDLPSLQLLQVETNRGIGASRQQLLDACQTDLAIWMDADDVCLPGRVGRLREFIEAGADWVFDAAELIDGESLQKIRDLPVPAHMLVADGEVWEFARNYIPSLGWAMIRTQAAREVGYDTTFTQAEDYEHLLRAILAKKSIRFCTQPGYQYYHYTTSVSRQLDHQNFWSEKALSNLTASDVEHRVFTSELAIADQHKIMTYFYIRTNAWSEAHRLSHKYMEADWEMAFMHGVACYYAMQINDAIRAFEHSLVLKRTACGLNNLGVCRLQAGNKLGRTEIEKSLELLPDYLDARANILVEEADWSKSGALKLTQFPLREQPIRENYR